MIEICKTCDVPLTKPYQSVNYKVNNIKTHLIKHNFDDIYENSVNLLKKKKITKYNNYNYLMLDLGKSYANRHIVWFTSKSNKNPTNIPTHKNAYKNYNMGLIKLDNNGFIKFHLPINTIYTEYGKTYPTHIHYLVSKKNYNIEQPFLDRFYTKNVLPKYNLSQFKSILNNKSMIPLNALTLYNSPIPNTYYLPVRIAKFYSK